MNATTLTGPMAAPVRVVARFVALPELLSPLQAEARLFDPPIDPQVLLRAQIAVEELFANSIRHGYGQECDSPVWLSVAYEKDVLAIEYADAAAPFDPISTPDPLSEFPAKPLDERRVGGVGRLLVRELASACEYRRADGRNVVLLKFTNPRPSGE